MGTDLSWFDEFCKNAGVVGLYIPKCDFKLQEHNFSFPSSPEAFFNIVFERCPSIYITEGEIEDIFKSGEEAIILIGRNREDNRPYNEEKEMEYKPEEG